MTCSMQGGRCPREATWVADVGGKMIDVMVMRELRMTTVRAQHRTLYACDLHRANLAQVAEWNGGTLRSV